MENELVFLGENGRPVTNSLKVAEIFDKRNRDVLRDIRNLSCSKEFHERNFALCQEIKQLEVGSTKTDYFQITKDGFTFLVMGYTGEKAAQFKEAYINAFNEMERCLRNANPDLNQMTKKDLARMLLESETERERIDKELSEKDAVISSMKREMIAHTEIVERINRMEFILLKTLEPAYQEKSKAKITSPKAPVRTMSSIRSMIQRQSPGAMVMSEVRKMLIEKHNINIRTKQLFDFFREKEWISTDKNQFNKPSEQCIDNGWMLTSLSGTMPNGLQYYTPYVTLKGFDYFADLILKKEKNLWTKS